MAKRNDPKGIRRGEIQKMNEMLRGGITIPLKRFLALCSYNMGLTRKTSMTYLQDLSDLGFIEFNEAENWIKEVVQG